MILNNLNEMNFVVETSFRLSSGRFFAENMKNSVKYLQKYSLDSHQVQLLLFLVSFFSEDMDSICK